MKKLLSLLVLCILLLQLTACGTNVDNRNEVGLRLRNYIDDSTTKIWIGADEVYFADGFTLAFQSNLSVEDMEISLSKSNPDYAFRVIDDKQIQMMSKGNYPYTLFSKNVVDVNGNPIDDVYVVVNESAEANINGDKICLPYHQIKNVFVFSEDDGQYSINSHIHDPYYNTVELQSSPRLTGMVAFYQDCGYDIEYEGGNTTGGCISVFEGGQYASESPKPLYKILVMSDGNERFAMQFCEGTDIHELKAEEVVEKYVEALNGKDTEAYLSCYEDIDDKSVEAFIDSVKSCKLNSSELFWRDQSREETIIKVNRTLISENGKQMGSYGTGEVDCTDYWLVKMIDGEPKIICLYKDFVDTVSELTVYKEFEKNET